MEFLTEATVPVISSALDMGSKLVTKKTLSNVLRSAGKSVVLALAGVGLYGILTGNSVNELYNKIMNGLDKVKVKGLFEKVINKFGETWGPRIFVFLVAYAVAEVLVVVYEKVIAKRLLGESTLLEEEAAGSQKPDKSLLKKALVGTAKAVHLIFPAIQVTDDGKVEFKVKGLKVSEYLRMFIFGLALGVLGASVYVSRKHGVSVKDGIKGVLSAIAEYVRTHKTAVAVVAGVSLVVLIYLFRDKIKSLFKKNEEKENK